MVAVGYVCEYGGGGGVGGGSTINRLFQTLHKI